MKFKVGDVVNFNWKTNIFFKVETIYNNFKYYESTATHSGIITKVDGEKIWIHEAMPKWKQRDFQAYLYSKDWIESSVTSGLITVRRSIAPLRNVEKIAKSYENTYYDIISVLLIPFKITVNSRDLQFCSEVVGRILYDASNHKTDIASEFGIVYDKLPPMLLQLTKQLEDVNGR